MNHTIVSTNLDMQESSTKVVSLSRNGRGVDELITKTAERVRLKIVNDRDKKTTILDTTILESWDSSEVLNIKIHTILKSTIDIIATNPDIGAGNATVKLIKDCLLLTNPSEYTEIKNKLLELTEYDSLGSISDDDLPVILLAFQGKRSN